MQYVIYLLLAVFCLMPVVVAQIVLKHDEKENAKGDDRP